MGSDHVPFWRAVEEETPSLTLIRDRSIAYNIPRLAIINPGTGIAKIIHDSTSSTCCPTPILPAQQVGADKPEASTKNNLAQKP